MTGRIVCLVALLASLPAGGVAQEAERRPADPATITAALADIRSADREADGIGYWPSAEGAFQVLTQRFELRSPAELDAFADELVRIAGRELAAAGTPLPRRLPASLAVVIALEAAWKGDGHGVAYEGALDALLRIWESEARTAPPGERWDRTYSLGALYDLDPDGRGRDLLHAEIAAAEIPAPVHNYSMPWCHLVRKVYDRHLGRSPEEMWDRAEADPENAAHHEAIVAWTLRQVEEELPGVSKPYADICGAGGRFIVG